MSEIRDTPARKAPPTAYKPGHSGNPGGRPKGTSEIRALFRANTQEAVDKIMDIMRNGSEAQQARMAVFVIERGWGMPGTEEPDLPHASIITGDVIIIDAKDGTDAAALAAELTEEAPIAEPAHSVGEPQPGTEDIPPKP